MQARVDLEIDGYVNRLADALGRDRGPVTAHQSGRARADQFRQIAAHLHVLDQQSGIAEMVMRVPHRHFMADRCAHMEDRLYCSVRHAERDDAFAVVVDDRHDIRTRLVERAMDEALEIRSAATAIERRAIERELHDVIRLDAVGRA